MATTVSAQLSSSNVWKEVSYPSDGRYTSTMQRGEPRCGFTSTDRIALKTASTSGDASNAAISKRVQSTFTLRNTRSAHRCRIRRLLNRWQKQYRHASGKCFSFPPAFYQSLTVTCTQGPLHAQVAAAKTVIDGSAFRSSQTIRSMHLSASKWSADSVFVLASGSFHPGVIEETPRSLQGSTTHQTFSTDLR